MKIGDNIRQIREMKNVLSKKHVAQCLGIKTNAYNNIEQNRADVTITRLYEIADIFGVSPEYILQYQNKSTSINDLKNDTRNQVSRNGQMENNIEKIKKLNEQIKKSKEEISASRSI